MEKIPHDDADHPVRYRPPCRLLCPYVFLLFFIINPLALGAGPGAPRPLGFPHIPVRRMIFTHIQLTHYEPYFWFFIMLVPLGSWLFSPSVPRLDGWIPQHLLDDKCFFGPSALCTLIATTIPPHPNATGYAPPSAWLVGCSLKSYMRPPTYLHLIPMDVDVASCFPPSILRPAISNRLIPECV